MTLYENQPQQVTEYLRYEIKRNMALGDWGPAQWAYHMSLKSNLAKWKAR